jgi:hypothetical protein
MPRMRRKWAPVRIDRHAVREGLQHIAKAAPELLHPSTGKEWRKDALNALEYIAQLEADLRRQGFTEYNDNEESNDQ